MNDSLEPILKRVQAALRQAAVAGVIHAPHALREAASYGEALNAMGLTTFAGQLAELADPHSSPDSTTRTLAEALRSVEIVMTYLLHPGQSPQGDWLPWPDESVLLEPVHDLAGAIHSASDLQWGWWLSHYGSADVLAAHNANLLELASGGNVSVRRRAIEALAGVATSAVVEGIAGQLGDERVGRAAMSTLIRLHEAGADVAEPAHRLVNNRQPYSRVGHAAAVLYRIGAYDRLLEVRSYPNHVVRCYAEMAALDERPLEERLPDDPLVRHITRCAAEDRSGEEGEVLLRGILTLQKQTLTQLCLHVAETPSGDRLLHYARYQFSARAPRVYRQKACLVLGVLGNSRDLPGLMELASQGIPEAYQALGMLGGEAVYSFLCDVEAGRRAGAHAGPAVHALGLLGDPRAVARLISLLNANPLHQRTAAAALAAMGSSEAVPHLIARLGKAQPFEIGTYVDALVQIDDPSAVAGFVDALSKNLMRMSPARKVLVRGLVHFGDHAVEAVAAMLNHDDTRVRAVAEEVLTLIQTTASRELLDSHLEKDPLHRLLTRLTYGSPESRDLAELELKEMSGPELAELMKRAFDDESQRVSLEEGRALLKAVEGLHFPEVVPQLRQLAADKHLGLARSAMDALSSFPYAVNRPTLMTRLQAGRLGEARRAVQVLSQQDMTVVSDVLGHLSSLNPNMRAGALAVLGAKHARWVAARALPLFDDPLPLVRQALAANIVQLSIPHLEHEAVTRLLVLLDSESGDQMPLLVSALEVLACGSQREDVHLALVASWRRQSRRQHQTLEALGAVGHPDSAELLVSQLAAGNAATVESAVIGLSRLGDPAGFRALEGAFDQMVSTSLFRSFHEALSRLSKGWHRLYRAQTALRRGNPQAAIAVIEDYLADNPDDDGSGYLERARARHQSGDISGAYEDYLEAGRKMRANNAAWHGAGLAAHLMGDVEAASRHFDNALQIRPDDIGVRLVRGLLNLEKLQYAAALADFQIVSGPRTTATSFDRRVAQVLWQVTALFAEAPANQPPGRVQLLGIMDRPLPDSLADLVLIWALILVGRFTEARQCLDRYEGRWPDARPCALLGASWLYAAAGEMARAREALDDLRDHAIQQGYHWPSYILYAFSDWPVVCEPLVRMLAEAVKE